MLNALKKSEDIYFEKDLRGDAIPNFIFFQLMLPGKRNWRTQMGSNH